MIGFYECLDSDFVTFVFSFKAECVGILMGSSGSMGSCAADNASVAMPRRLVSLRYLHEYTGSW